MAWQDTMISILRVLINDQDCGEGHTYSDTQLEITLAVAAQYIQQELSFSTTYTITINPPDIDPDPTVTATLDDAFTNFVVLKAACTIDNWTFRTKAALEGLTARAGNNVSLAVSGHLKGFRDLIEIGPCKTLEDLKKDWKFGNANNVRAILSPFNSNSFNLLYRTGFNSNDRE